MGWVREHDVPITAVTLIVLFWSAIGWGVTVEVKRDNELIEALSYIGEEADIRAFARATDFSYRDVLESKAAQKAFEKFMDGELQINKTKKSSRVIPLIVG